MINEAEKLIDGQWHLDKKVPIAMILAFVLQTITLVYVGTTWKDDIDNRITVLEKSDANQTNHGDRILILEQSINHMISSLDRIEKTLTERRGLQ